MGESYCCPLCGKDVRRMSRGLDFFCRHCLSSLVVIDEHWAHLLGPEDAHPQVISVARCKRLVGSGPLVALG